MADLFTNNSRMERISRSKIEEFIQCPRCFYLETKYNLKKPSWPPFTLNQAVDSLLKKEFDFYRLNGQKLPFFEKDDLDLFPLNHQEINTWRNKGIEYFHRETNLIVYGKIDDILQDSQGNLYIVDFKATSTSQEITLNDEYKEAYKREVEIYKWLFEKNNYPISKIAYFVFCNATKADGRFNGRLNFEFSIIKYECRSDWIEKVLNEIRETLNLNKAPLPSEKCDYCNYYEKRKILD